jgi:circadian clock protein KaiB
MNTKRASVSTRQIENWFERSGRDRYVLSLFIAGMTLRSADAVARIKGLCEKYLPGRYELEIIDIYQQPELAKLYQVFAVPTLVKRSPAPARRLIGDLQHAEEVLRGLDIRDTRAKR